MLTADLNVAMVEWIVQYRVAEPYKYLYKVRELTDTFRAMNEAVMRGVIGDHLVTEVLTVGREQIEGLVKQQLQDLCDQYDTGITLDQVVLQDVNPPDPVKPSWDEVNRAQQQRDRLINEAQQEFNEEIPRARGEAEQAVLQSRGYATDRVNRAEGDAARFTSLVNEYRRAPDVTRRRMYLETVSKVLPRIGGKLLLDDGASGVLPLLNISNLQETPGHPQEAARRATTMKRLAIIAVPLILVAIVLIDGLYVVSETDQVIITQFGKPVGDPVIEPGLHFKTPFVQQINRFEKRFLEWDGDPNQMPTRDKRFIWVDTYARWRISDPLKFFPTPPRRARRSVPPR